MKRAFRKIEVRENTFQQIEVLKRNRKKRTQYGLFVVESVAAIKAAVSFQWEIQYLCFSFERALSDWARGMIEETEGELLGFSDELMNELSEREDGSELIAIVRVRPDNLSRISMKKDSVLVVLDRPSSPGNLGSTIRSADAFGASGVIVIGHAADIYDPVSVRSSLGALFATPVVRVDSPNKLKEWLREQIWSVKILGTSVRADATPEVIQFTKPLALVLGNETSGMSSRFEEICDELVGVPMRGVASSINVSCAATLFLYLATVHSNESPKC